MSGEGERTAALSEAMRRGRPDAYQATQRASAGEAGRLRQDVLRHAAASRNFDRLQRLVLELEHGDAGPRFVCDVGSVSCGTGHELVLAAGRFFLNC